MMDDLLEQFLIEGRDLVAQAHGDLAALGREPQRRDRLDSLFRAVHTLKGSVALFDMAPAERLLHRAETRLDQTRRGDAPLIARDFEGLIAVIDQIDRWIDDIERHGRLPDAAESRGAEILAALDHEEPQAPATHDAGGLPDWAEAALARAPLDVRHPARTAFRYSPDPECFFRGEDPLALARSVPGLLALNLLPTEKTPALEDVEPFRCVLHIEGLSSTGIDAVRTAFRMVPDQIALAALEADGEGEHREGRTEADGTQPETAETNGAMRVSSAKLDALAAEVGQLAAALNALEAATERAGAFDRDFSAELRRVHGALSRSLGTLSATVSEVRRVPIEPVVRRLPRLARELAASLGKDLRFELAGEGLEVDKQVADAIFEPLLHLLRNAIDHGIEAPEVRVQSGKSASGAVGLGFSRSGDHLSIVLSDDGRGMDPDVIRRAAVAKGLLEGAEAAGLTDRQALRLVFAPGFSTSQAVTEVSGRGVGMDAVQRAIERLQGTIEIESTVGQGTRIGIRLPLNAILTRLVTVCAGGDRYGLRMDQIDETLRLDPATIEEVGHGRACTIRDRTVPVVSLAALLGHASDVGEESGRLVVTGATGQRVALSVDTVGERIDAAVRERSGLLASIPAIGGTAIDADGGVLLVLDLPELLA